MIDLSRAYHVGVRVPDIGTAMAEMGAPLGLTWCSVQEREQSVWTPESGSCDVGLKFTYSAEGPQHLELLEGTPGSIWDGAGCTGAHHLGVWADDVASATGALVDRGWRVVAAQNEPSRGYGVFTYVAPPSGLIVELVWSGLEAMFHRWWAGGSLG